MFKNYYTTAMSGEGKLIEKRFRHIVSFRKAGRLRTAAASVTAAAIASAALFASGVLADSFGMFGAGEIAVLVNGRGVSLKNKPFTDNSEIYVPLRETLNACGVADENITYLDGRVNMTLHSDVTGADYTAHINIGENDIRFDNDDAPDYKLINGARTTTHPALLRDGVTYAPLGMFIRVKQYNIKLTDEARYINDFRYNRALPVKLLKGLTIRQYDENGAFDIVLEDWTTAESLKPEDYYENGERVIIGDAKTQDGQGYHYTTVNDYYFPTSAVKRILTDGDGNVTAVVPVENQRHEAVNGSGLSSMYASFGELGWASVGTGSIGLPNESTESDDPKDRNWLVDNYMVCDPATATVGVTSAQCFYVPVELITHRVERTEAAGE